MKKFALLLVFVYLSIFTVHTIVSAVNPASPFSPGENIQDPNCLPSESNCYVTFAMPSSAAPTVDYNGEIAYDTTVTDFSTGVIRFYGTEEQGIVALPIAEFTAPTDGQIVAYNSTNDEFELVTPTTITFGTDNQVPFTNAGGTDFEYSADLTYDGSVFTIGSAGGLLLDNITIQNIGTRSISIGAGTPAVTDSFFYGTNAGLTATSANNSIFIGAEAGELATSALSSIFLGLQAGENATTAEYSVFLGDSAGEDSTNANEAVFIGRRAGSGAPSAENSVFLGEDAGFSADNASESIFIGTAAGSSDTVSNDNTSYSILLGPATSTGGFSRSIAIGRGATNTATNQLVIGSSTGNTNYISNVFFGSGVTATSPQGVTINGSGGSGLDIAGAALTFAGGKATGNATGGSIIFQTSDAGASSSTLQSLTTKATLLASGNFGVGDSTPAALFTVGNGDLFQVASDGSVDAVTGYIQGSGTMSLTSANTTQTTTSSIFALNANSLTTGSGMYLASSTLTSGSLIDLAITGTGAIDTQKGINISLTGANATGSQTSYGVYVSNAHSGTNPHNIALYGTVANGSTVSAGVVGNNSGSGYGVSGVSTSGSGVNASSTSGTGITAATTTGTYAGSFQTNPTSTNTAASVLGINRFSSGTPAAGIGASILFNIENDGGSAFEANSLVSSWTDVTHATRTSEFYITGVNSGTTGTLMTLEGNGEVGIGTSDPSTMLHAVAVASSGGAPKDVLTLAANTTDGTVATGFGPGILFQGESTTTENRDMVQLQAVWGTSSADASRTSALLYKDVNSAGALTERFRFTPSSMTTATSYTLGNSSSTITLGNSTYQVSVTSSTVNVGNAAIFSPANTSDMTFGKSISGSSGSATYTALSITNGFNMTGTQSGIMRGININPTLTSLTAATYRAIDIQANHASVYGIYQSGASSQNYFAGEVGIANSSPGVALHVGSASTTDATTLLRLEDANSTCNFTADAGAPTCGSDERLKKDISELSTEEILAGITALNPVSYRWKTDSENAELQYGFLAQNVQEQFPNLVKEGTWIDGSQKLFLSMGGLMPYAVGAIKELNIKLTAIENFEEENNSFGQKLRAWLSNSTNKITRIFTGEICLTDPGEEAVCLNRSELKNLKALLSESSSQNSSNESNNDSSNGESAPVVENEPQEVVEEVVVPEGPETIVEDTETETEEGVEASSPDSSTQEETVTESEPEVPTEEESSVEEVVSQAPENTEAESTTE